MDRKYTSDILENGAIIFETDALVICQDNKMGDDYIHCYHRKEVVTCTGFKYYSSWLHGLSFLVRYGKYYDSHTLNFGGGLGCFDSLDQVVEAAKSYYSV